MSGLLRRPRVARLPATPQVCRGSPDRLCVKGPEAARAVVLVLGDKRQREAACAPEHCSDRLATRRRWVDRRPPPRGRVAADVRAARRARADPGGRPGGAGGHRARRGHPLNLFRVHWHNARRPRRPGRRTRAPRAAARADRGRRAHRRRPRRPLPADRRAQGPRRLRLPRAAARHGRVRPDHATAPSGRRPATTAGAASPSRGSWAAAASPSCPRA